MFENLSHATPVESNTVRSMVSIQRPGSRSATIIPFSAVGRGVKHASVAQPKIVAISHAKMAAVESNIPGVGCVRHPANSNAPQGLPIDPARRYAHGGGAQNASINLHTRVDAVSNLHIRRAQQSVAAPLDLSIQTGSQSRLDLHANPQLTARATQINPHAKADISAVNVTADSVHLKSVSGGAEISAGKSEGGALKSDLGDGHVAPHGLSEKASAGAGEIADDLTYLRVGDVSNSHQTTALLEDFGGRNRPGIAHASAPLVDSEKLLRGTNGNAGYVPVEIAQMLEGRTFNSFDDFREAFWLAVSQSKYASEFGALNIKKMSSGGAPISYPMQWLGERKVYELHHITPISKGGSVYDLSNILISTPRYHLDVLSRSYHYKGKK